MKSRFESLGDRMKEYEQAEAGRSAMKGLPLLARLDGRSFHSYTKGLDRPYDLNLSKCMISTMEYLVKEFHCVIGYTQSDEISLLWYSPPEDSTEYLFSGKYQKLCSVLAASASAFFARAVMEHLPAKNSMLPTFDCRVWQVPSKEEAANVFYWRELDATKNAISMAAHAHFSASRLHKVNGAEKQELLFKEKGINFNDYPVFFKRGTYSKRVLVESVLDDEIKRKIPLNQTIPASVVRSKIVQVDWPVCSSIANYAALIFGDESEPVLKSEAK